MNEARGDGFASGFFAGTASSFVSHGEFSSNWNDTQHAIAAAVVGGTAARLGGGKFENGAVTGAFQFLFNSKLSSHAREREARERYQNLLDANSDLGEGGVLEIHEHDVYNVADPNGSVQASIDGARSRLSFLSFFGRRSNSKMKIPRYGVIDIMITTGVEATQYAGNRFLDFDQHILDLSKAKSVYRTDFRVVLFERTNTGWHFHYDSGWTNVRIGHGNNFFSYDAALQASRDAAGRRSNQRVNEIFGL